MPDFNDTYNFSPEFMQMLSQAAQQDPLAPQDDVEEVEPVDDAEPDTNDELEQLKASHEELMAENERLQAQLNDPKYSDNPDVLNDDLLGRPDDSNDSILNMVLQDETSDLSWIKKKSSSVNLTDISPTLANYLNTLPEDLKSKVLATSGDDQEHVTNSKHYQGNAVDLRYFPELHNYIANDPNARKMGINVLNPNHGTAKHSHIQVKQYGGGTKPTTLNRQQQLEYDRWRSQLPKNLQYEGDYDLKGLWLDNPNVKPSPNLHFTDKYKLPNHPTFSDESKYFNDQTKDYAGHWTETDSSWNYIPYNPVVKKPIMERKYNVNQ